MAPDERAEMKYTDRELRASMGRMLAELEQTAVKERTKKAIFDFQKMREVFEEKYHCDWEKERKQYQKQLER